MGGPDLAPRMTANRVLVERYLTRKSTSELGVLLADDVEWVEWADGVPPSGVVTRGKAGFLANFGNDELRSEVHRIVEENGVVVAEGTAHVTKKDGTQLAVRFVNVFELADGKVKRLSSFGALLKATA